MKATRLIAAVVCATAIIFLTTDGHAANLSFVGAQYDLPFGGIAGASSPPFNTAGWRSSHQDNIFATGDAFPEQYYGKAGWALFAATFSYPNPNVFLDANVPIAGNATHMNLSDLPSWVTGSQIHATRLAGGSPYSLIDDPRLMSGIRHWTFDGVNYPPAEPGNNTGQNPYVSIGFIVGNPTTLDPNGNPDRWSFTVGSDVPSVFRVGVMNDGLNDPNFASNFINMRQLGDDSSLVSSGTLTNRNRQVDMIFFDIAGAQPGDTFVISASASNSRIGGISFDVVVPEPASISLILAGVGLAAVLRRGSSH